MARKAKKLNATTQAYRRNRARIQNFIRKAEKRGYVFPENILPSVPKRITAGSVRRLEKLTPKALYERAEFVDTSTGELVSGARGRQIERSQSAEKAKRTRQIKKQEKSQKRSQPSPEPFTAPLKVNDDRDMWAKMTISNWIRNLQLYAYGSAYNMLLSWMRQIRADNGDLAVALALQEAIDNDMLLTAEVVYNGGAAMNYISTITQMIPDQGVLYRDTLMDKMEFVRDLSDTLEELEDWEEPL